MCSEMFYGHKSHSFPDLILAPREKIFFCWMVAPFRPIRILGGSFFSKWVMPGPSEGWREHVTEGVYNPGSLGQIRDHTVSLHFPLRDTQNILSCQIGKLPWVLISQKGIMSASRIYTLPRWAWNWILFRQSKHLWWFISHHWTKKVKAQITTLHT